MNKYIIFMLAEVGLWRLCELTSLRFIHNFTEVQVMNQFCALSESHCHGAEGLSGGRGRELRGGHPLLSARCQVFSAYFETCVKMTLNNASNVTTQHHNNWCLLSPPISLYLSVHHYHWSIASAGEMMSKQSVCTQTSVCTCLCEPACQF